VVSFLRAVLRGRNLGKPFCQDFMAWALAAAALVVVFLELWILGRLWRACRGWMHRRMLAKVADAETMKKPRVVGATIPRTPCPRPNSRARKRPRKSK